MVAIEKKTILIRVDTGQGKIDIIRCKLLTDQGVIDKFQFASPVSDIQHTAIVCTTILKFNVLECHVPGTIKPGDIIVRKTGGIIDD